MSVKAKDLKKWNAFLVVLGLFTRDIAKDPHQQTIGINVAPPEVIDIAP